MRRRRRDGGRRMLVCRGRTAARQSRRRRLFRGVTVVVVVDASPSTPAAVDGGAPGAVSSAGGGEAGQGQRRAEAETLAQLGVDRGCVLQRVARSSGATMRARRRNPSAEMSRPVPGPSFSIAANASPAATNARYRSAPVPGRESSRRRSTGARRSHALRNSSGTGSRSPGSAAISTSTMS
jgi:hypothetical protein